MWKLKGHHPSVPLWYYFSSNSDNWWLHRSFWIVLYNCILTVLQLLQYHETCLHFSIYTHFSLRRSRCTLLDFMFDCVNTFSITDTDLTQLTLPALRLATICCRDNCLFSSQNTRVRTLKQYNIKNIYSYHNQNKYIDINSITYRYTLVRTIKNTDF